MNQNEYKAPPCAEGSHRFGDWHTVKKFTCTEGGEYERVCPCGARELQKIPPRGDHIPGAWETVKAPTEQSDGLKLRHCLICGAQAERETLPALPKSASKGLRYAVLEDGTSCAVTGPGTCKDKNVVIPPFIDGYRVTDIGARAFAHNESLESIVLPDSVTSIGEYAFHYAERLARIALPDAVTDIGNGAFSYCESLTQIVIPDSVIFIGEYAFFGNEKLTDIAIPESVTYIGGSAFGNCKKFTRITIPESVTYVGQSAFFGCSDLTDVTIPDSVTLISEGAFAWCTKLTGVTLGNSVTKIGDGAFSGCRRLTSIAIPDSVTAIGKNAFAWCENLTAVTVGNSAAEIGEQAFFGCAKLESLLLPDSVTHIGAKAFAGCESLTSVAYEGNKAQWERIYKPIAWNKDSSLQTVTLNAGCVDSCGTSKNIVDHEEQTVLFLASQGLEYRVNNDQKTCSVIAQGTCADRDIVIPESIDGYRVTELKAEGYEAIFQRNITSVVIPNSVTVIGNNVFRLCTELTSVTIPDSVTLIGEFAFSACTQLTSVTLPDSVTHIGAYAFNYCTGLASLRIPDAVTHIGEGAFVGVGEVLLSKDHPHYILKNGALFTKDMRTLLYYAPNGKETAFTVPDSVTAIESFAFNRAKNLTHVEIGDSVTSVGAYAFADCKKLTSVKLGGAVTCIGTHAFSGCKSLASLSVPNSVTFIGACAFSGCEGLSSIQYDGTKKAWKQIALDEKWSENSAIQKAECRNGKVRF